MLPDLAVWREREGERERERGGEMGKRGERGKNGGPKKKEERGGRSEYWMTAGRGRWGRGMNRWREGGREGGT